MQGNDNFSSVQLADMAVPDGWFLASDMDPSQPLPFVCRSIYNNSDTEIQVDVVTEGNPDDDVVLPIGPYQFIEGNFTYLSSSDDSNTLISCHGKRFLTTPVLTLGATGGDNQQLNWSAVVGAAHYLVYLATDPAGPFDFYSDVVDATTENVADLDPGTTYYYRIAAFTDLAHSQPSNIVTSETNDVPDAPVISIDEISDTEVAISWSQPDDHHSEITGYGILISTNGSAFSPLDTSPIPSYTATGLTPMTEYWFQVQAINGVGTSAVSNTLHLTTYSIPDAPTLSAGATGSTTQALSWVAGASHGSAIDHYTIYSSPDGLDYEGFDSTSLTSYGITGLNPSSEYWFKVTETNGIGESTASNVVDIITGGAPLPPTLSLDSSADTTQELSWTNASDNNVIDIFNIYFSTDGDVFVLADTSPGPTFHATALTPSTQYWYYITAVHAMLESDPSNIVTGSTTA